MSVFVMVVERGSMRGAARSLGLTPSAVSQQIRQLERETGVTLLHRSTRRLALTDAGQAFYEGCVAMMAAARSAHERLAELQDDVRGELSISAPVGFAGTHLSGAMAPLLAEHPDLTLRLIATDDQLDLQKERIDIAVSIGTTPPATTLVRKHLADWPNVLVAAPSYLKQHGTPAAPGDLADHRFISLPSWHHAGDVLTGPHGERHRVTANARVISNNQTLIRQLAVAGCGLCFNVVPEITRELAQRRLVRVLPKWAAPALSVDALMLPRATQPAKVRIAVQALTRYMKSVT